MRQTAIRPMVEGGVLAAVAIIFALISAYMPLVGPFVNLIWPVPIILLGVRHGYKWSILATLVAGFIIAMLMHPLQAVSVVLGFGLIGIVLGHAFRAGLSPAKALLWGALASLLSKALVVGISLVVMGVNPLDMQTDFMTQALDQAMSFYRSMGMKEEDLARTSETMKTIINLMKIVLPTGFIFAAIVDTYLNFWVAKAVLKKLGHHIEGFPPFKLWNLPRAVLYLFVFGLGGTWYGQASGMTMLYNIALNVQVFASILLLVQGMAVFYYLTDKYNLSRMVRGIILFLILSNGLLTQIIVFAGAFDMLFDYRKLRTSRPV